MSWISKGDSNIARRFDSLKFAEGKLRNLTAKTAAWFMLAPARRRYLALFAAGLLSALAMPPVDLFPVFFLTLPALVWAMDGTFADSSHSWLGTIWSGFLPGWWFGFGYFLAGLWWIGNALLVEADLFAWAIPLAVIVLPGLLAIFWGAATLACRLFWRDGLSRIAVLTVMLAGGEFLRGVLFTGFPWNTIGYAAMPWPVAMQSASVIGLYGVTLLAIPAFALPGVALGEQVLSRRKRITAIMIALALVTAHLGFGVYRMYFTPKVPDTDIRVRLVQPNVEQRSKFDPNATESIIADYIALSKGKNEQGEGLDAIRFVIWPESAFPFLLTERADVLAAIADMLPGNTQLITGAMRAEPGSANEPYGRVYNSVYIIDSNGEIIEAADKVHLVPFGEYLPFQAMLESIGLEQLTRLQGGFDAGADRNMLAADTDYPFIPLICYEIIFPGEIRPEGPGAGEAKWLVNLTNDAWFGATPGPYQHFRFAVVRGVEEGLPVVRVANTGISGVTDAFGRRITSLSLGEKGAKDATLPGIAAPTLFSRYGNTLFSILLILIALLMLSPARRS